MVGMGKPFDFSDTRHKGDRPTGSNCAVITESGCRTGYPNSQYIRPTLSSTILLRINNPLIVSSVSLGISYPWYLENIDNPGPVEIANQSNYIAACVITPGDYEMIASGNNDSLTFIKQLPTTIKVYQNLPQEGGTYIFGNASQYEVNDFAINYAGKIYQGDNGDGSEAGELTGPCRFFDPDDGQQFLPDFYYLYTQTGKAIPVGINASSVLMISSCTVTFRLDILKRDSDNKDCFGRSVDFLQYRSERYWADTVKFRVFISALTTPYGNGNVGKYLFNSCNECFYWCYTTVSTNDIYLPVFLVNPTTLGQLSATNSQIQILQNNPLYEG